MPPGEPPLDPLQLRLLPLADRFMWLMLSRPGGLSLRTSWVTPATLALALTIAPLATAAGVAAILVGVLSSLPLVAAGVGSLLVAIGAGSLGMFGVRQRLLVKSSQR